MSKIDKLQEAYDNQCQDGFDINEREEKIAEIESKIWKNYENDSSKVFDCIGFYFYVLSKNDGRFNFDKQIDILNKSICNKNSIISLIAKCAVELVAIATYDAELEKKNEHIIERSDQTNPSL